MINRPATAMWPVGVGAAGGCAKGSQSIRSVAGGRRPSQAGSTTDLKSEAAQPAATFGSFFIDSATAASG